MENDGVENIEITLLLEGIFLRYGHDFRSYGRASVERRIRQFQEKSGYAAISEMIPKLLRDETFFQGLLRDLSITVTEMFRDPFVYRRIREKVIPLLHTYPFIKIWHAGCATGEEAYSLAIVLQEEGLYERATIFATDFNDTALEKAKTGIYPMDNVKLFTNNYHGSGGTLPFSEYYHAHYESMAISPSLKKRIVFANHNLVTDAVFSEMHMILCRNVLIYFDATLQKKVLGLFRESLIRGGFLCLGNKESLRFSDVEKDFNTIDDKGKIYRKKIL